MRLTYSDRSPQSREAGRSLRQLRRARRGQSSRAWTQAEVGELRRPGHQQARRGRRPKTVAAAGFSRTFLERRRVRVSRIVAAAGTTMGDGSDAARRAGERRESRASARSLPRGHSPRAGADRAEPLGRRPGRARPAERCGALLGGPIGTFDDLFEKIAPATRRRRPVAGDAQRALVVRRAVAARSARRARALGAPRRLRRRARARRWRSSSRACRPGDLDGDLASSTRAYRAELDRLGLWDRDLRRRSRPTGVASDLAAWDGEPVFAYGFEDLTCRPSGALLEALAGARRRHRLAAVRAGPRRVRLARAHASEISRGSPPAGSRSCRPRYAEYAHPALAHLERALFEDRRRRPPPLDGAVRFLEGAGVARRRSSSSREEILDLLRSGTAPEEIARRLPLASTAARAARDRLRRARDPYALEDAAAARRRRSGARCSRCSASPGSAAAAATCSASSARRTRASSARTSTSSRGACAAAVSVRRERVEEETLKLRGAAARRPRPPARSADAGRGRARRSRARCCAPPTGSRRRRPATPPGSTCARYEAVARAARRARGLETLGGAPVARGRRRRARAGDRTRRSAPASRAASPSLDLLRARTRRFEAVFVLGLEEGSLPRRGAGVPVPRRRPRGASSTARRGCERPTRSSRDRYLFYTACTRARRRLYLVREAATDDGAPREPSPFWDEVARALRAGRRRALDDAGAALRPHVAARACADRARARCARSPRSSPGRPGRRALAARERWERRLERASRAFDRPTRLAAPGRARAAGARAMFGVTELETLRRLLLDLVRRAGRRPEDDRRRGRREAARLDRAPDAVQVLLRAAEGARRRPRRRRSSSSDALAFLRACLDEAIAGGVRLELTDLQRSELDAGALARPRGASSATRRESELRSSRAASRSRSARERSAPELQRGLDLATVSRSPGRSTASTSTRSARAGSSRTTSRARPRTRPRRSRRSCSCRSRCTCSSCATSSGSSRSAALYRALAGERNARGLLREARRTTCPGFVANDYLDEDDFWAQVEARAGDGATAASSRGSAPATSAHDPKGGDRARVVRAVAHRAG